MSAMGQEPRGSTSKLQEPHKATRYKKAGMSGGGGTCCVVGVVGRRKLE